MSEDKSDRVIIKFGPNSLSSPTNTKAYIDSLFNNANVSVNGVTYKVNNGAAGYTGKTKNTPSTNYNTSAPDSTYDPTNPSSVYNATAEYDPNNPNSVYNDQNTFYPNKPSSNTTATNPSNPNSTPTLNNQNNNVGGNNGSGGNGGTGINPPLSVDQFAIVPPPGNPTNPPSSGLAPNGYTFYVPSAPTATYAYNGFAIAGAVIQFDVVIDPVPAGAASLYMAPYNSINNNPGLYLPLNNYTGWSGYTCSNRATHTSGTFHFTSALYFTPPNVLGFSATTTRFSMYVDNVQNISVGDNIYIQHSYGNWSNKTVTVVNKVSNIICFDENNAGNPFLTSTGIIVLTALPVTGGFFTFDLNFDPENINRSGNITTGSDAVSVLSYANTIW